MTKPTLNNPGDMTFETFILSIGTATLVALGEVDNPVTGKRDKNLGAAKQHIDILEILAKKTSGNLSAVEQKLLDDILYETRLKFVSQTTKS